MNCLEKVVGLTEKECECLEGQLPEGAGSSVSGFYLDDLEDSIPLLIPQKTRDCGESSIWTLLERARKEGIRDFISDFHKFFYANNHIRLPAFKGRMGELSSNQKINTPDSHLGVIFKPKKILGLRMVVRGFRTRTMNSDNTVSRITITNSENITSHTIDQDIVFSKKHKTTNLDIPIILPLADQNGEPINYTFTYDTNYDEEIIPANSTCGCNCGRSPEWSRFGEVKGTFAATTDYEEFTERTKYNYGLQPIVEITCEGFDFICAPMDDDSSVSLNNEITDYGSGKGLYRSHPYFVTVAKLVQLYSINKVISSVLRSDKINKFTILHDKKDLYARRSSNRKKIEGHIMWLAENTPHEFTDCYACRSNQRITKITPNL